MAISKVESGGMLARFLFLLLVGIVLVIIMSYVIVDTKTLNRYEIDEKDERSNNHISTVTDNDVTFRLPPGGGTDSSNGGIGKDTNPDSNTSDVVIRSRISKGNTGVFGEGYISTSDGVTSRPKINTDKIDSVDKIVLPMSVDRDLNNANVSNKIILFWNNFFRSVDYGVGTGSDALKQANCPVYQCTITRNKSELNRADAVFIHSFGLTPAYLPRRFSQDQIFVFFLYESPMKAGGPRSKLSALDDAFNLTFTYLEHPDTDIYGSIGHSVRKPQSSPMAVPSPERLRAKPKLVLWIVSNCWPQSVRNLYYKELLKYVPVDVYGACGNLSCTSSLPGIKCIRNLSASYMFYLAFENGFCQGYYTEKAFHPLVHNMVPITLGGANYTKYLPPNSFIDVRDFGSVKELADRLLYLRENINEYRKYFLWKEFYQIRSNRTQGFCKLCEILHTPNYIYKSRFSVADYWNPEKLCLNRSEQSKLLQLD